MKKIIMIVLLCVLVCGCSKNKIERVYLDDSYYSDEGFITSSKEEVDSLEGNFILYTYNNYCKFPVSCEDIFEEFMDEYKIRFVSLPYVDFKETSYYKTVKYAPSIIIIEDKKVVAYLDADSDEDVDKYQKVDQLKEWLEKYVYLEKE